MFHVPYLYYVLYRGQKKIFTITYKQKSDDLTVFEPKQLAACMKKRGV